MEFETTIEGVTVSIECELCEVVAVLGPDDSPMPEEWCAAHATAIRDAFADVSCAERERMDQAAAERR